MRIKTILNIILLSILFSSCYTILEKRERISDALTPHQKIFSNQPIIDNRLIGKWRKTFEVIDVGLGTQILYFNQNGKLHYQLYYKNLLVNNYQGEYRSLSDTLLIKFNFSDKIEELTFSFRNDQLFLKNLGSSYSINHYPSRNGFEYEGL